MTISSRLAESLMRPTVPNSQGPQYLCLGRACQVALIILHQSHIGLGKIRR
jgi:hypothetical protein